MTAFNNQFAKIPENLTISSYKQDHLDLASQVIPCIPGFTILVFRYEKYFAYLKSI